MDHDQRFHENDKKDRSKDGRHPYLTGAEGGFFATIVMTLFREPTARALPPTAGFLAQYLGREPEDYPLPALGLHLLYGTCAGILFAPFLMVLSNSTDEPETVGLIAGSIYGVAMSVFGEKFVLGCLLGMNLDTDEVAVFHAGHLIYGLTLGAWIGSRSWVGAQ